MADDALARIEAKLDLLLTTVMTRLLDAVVPTAEMVEARSQDTGARDLGEADGPDEMATWAGVQDWTDPFIGIDQARPVNQVARLEPGEAIPGIPVPDGAGDGMMGAAAVDRWRESGAAAFDEWNRDTHLPDGGGGAVVAAWVEPLEI